MTLGLAILACSLAAGTCHAAADPTVTSYAVRVRAQSDAIVRLTALDVPRGWTASFCTPHVCSPSHVELPVHNGSGTIQLSYVRSAPAARALRALHVAARSAGGRADARLSLTP